MSSRIVEIHPGDTTNIVSITLEGVTDYTDYTGSVEVFTEIGTAALITRTFAAGVAGLDFFLTAEETGSLDTGIYVYVYTIDKTVLTVVEYHREIQVTLIVTEDAIVTGYTVQDIINIAKYGELQQLEVKNDPEAIMTYINLGLIEIYKRFNIDVKEQLVDLKDNVTMYKLNSDCMQVVEVYDELGKEVPLNDETNVLSVMTPSYNLIQVPMPETGATLAVMYYANHSKVTNVNDGVNIPPQLLEALLHYIGYRGHGSMDSLINTENNTHYMRFEASCAKVKSLGMLTKDNILNTNFEDKGFV